ncbi:MAG: tRNA pseudouridine synthase B [Verrucomicrobia bacterium ADurb.Bin345]|nr:MAG: tRNA pseudouridine synthase B [Verrucomicrobia bacterium ADurb.Bin345]
MNRRSDNDPFEGLLLVDKPAGPTSHDIVDAIRRHFRFRKVGHGGTLDPMATGLLVILLGRGTKLSNYVIGSDKTYEGTMRLGITTNTDDADGEETGRADCAGVTRAQVEAEMKKLTGDLMQTPPMVSAVKVKGVPLYKLARKGQEVEREPRLIHVYEFTLKQFASPEADFILRCTKGTYVRTLCADIGRALGCGAHLNRLRRTQSGRLTVERAIALDKLLKLELPQLEEFVIPVHQVVLEGLHP